jgi:hypothetical protein
MRVIPPLNTDGFTITEAMLTDSDAAEPGTGEVAWSSGTAYAVGDQVYLASTHRLYEARTVSTNKNPALATPETPSADWQDIGPTNRWAMFDTLRATGTVFSGGTGVVEITPGRRIDSVGVAGLVDVDTARVEYIRDDVTVYDSSELDLRYRFVTTYYQFCFAPFLFRREFAYFDLPPYTDGKVRLTFTRESGGDLAVGAVLVGMNQHIGRGLHGAEDDAINFSRFDRAFDGTASVQRRRNVPKNAIALVVDKAEYSRIRKVRDDLNAVPAMYVGIDNDRDGYYSGLFRLGLYRQWKFNTANPSHATATLEIEEL